MAELRTKGVGRETVAEALESSSESQLDVAIRAGLRKAARDEALDERSFSASLSPYLLRRGFDYAVVRAAVRELWSRRSDCPGSRAD